MLNQKGVVQLFLIIILLLGIIALVYLVQKTQIFKPKAYYVPTITLTNGSGIPLPNKITDPNVHILIKLPNEWELPSGEGPLLQNIVKSANAQEFGGGSEDIPVPIPVSAPIASGPAYPKPEKRTLKKLTIKSAFISTGQTSSGSEKLEVTSDFKNYFNRPIPWKLHSLPEGETENYRTVMVAFSDGTEFGEDLYEASTVLINPSQSLDPEDELLVDIFIDSDYSDPTAVEAWIKDALDNFVNDKLATYEIKRKVKFNSSTVKQIGSGCDDAYIGQEYDLKNNHIRVVLGQENFVSYAVPYQNWLCLSSPINEEYDKNVLLHEIGHIFGLPDYYRQDVYANEVIPGLYIASEIDDVMRHNKPYFSATSREIINRLSTPLPGHTQFWNYYVPKQFILQIMDNSNSPIPGVSVEVFPAIIKSYPEYNYSYPVIPNLLSFERVTDGTGRVFLGDQEYIFSHHDPFYQYQALGGSALIRITYNGEVRYATLTLSHLNNLYFERGLTNFATITTAFSQLIEAPQYGNITIKTFNKFSTEKTLSQAEREKLDQHLYQQLRVQKEVNTP